jgi:hypothetical protein
MRGGLSSAACLYDIEPGFLKYFKQGVPHVRIVVDDK